MKLVRIVLNAAMYADKQDLIGQLIRKAIRDSGLFPDCCITIYCNNEVKPLDHARIAIAKDQIVLSRYSVASLKPFSLRGQPGISTIVRSVLCSIEEPKIWDLDRIEVQTSTPISRELSPGTANVDISLAIIAIGNNKINQCEGIDASRIALTENKRIKGKRYEYNIGYLPATRSFCVLRYSGSLIQRLSFYQSIAMPEQSIVGYCEAIVFPRIPACIYSQLIEFLEYGEKHTDA